MSARTIPLLAAAALAFAAVRPADAGEAYAILASTQEIQGLVPAGEDIRLEFPIAAGAEPRLVLALTGGKETQPISISERILIGPDGNEIFLPENAFFDTKYTKGNPTLSFKGWIATQSGNHQILIRTKARVLARAKGKLVVKRPTSIPVQGDESTPQIKISLQPGDSTSLALKRVSGTAPKVIQYKIPSGTQFMPGQEVSKTGTKSRPLLATQFGEFTYTIGYQDAAAAAGAWKGKLKLKPFKGGAPVTLRLRNSPGIPLSVRDADRFVTVTFGTERVGLASDGSQLLVTSEQAGVLNAQYFDRELAASLLTPNPVALTTSLDFTPGETLLGHRLIRAAGFYFIGLSTASGTELELIRLRGDLVRDSYAQIVSASPDPTADFFLGASDTRLAIGIAHAPNQHNVVLVNPSDFAGRTNVVAGGATRPMKPGSGISWRPDDSVFEVWTPDTLDYHGPSDLHRLLFDVNFAPTTADAKPINDPSLVETMPTAVSVDPQSGVTVLHYVVADNPPLVNAAAGSGQIHRRLFDATGTPIPDSAKTLTRESCQRPVSAIFGNFLYLGFDTPSGPIVERYPLLR